MLLGVMAVVLGSYALSKPPSLERLVSEAGWTPTPELSGAFQAGAVFEQNGVAQRPWAAAGTCMTKEVTSFSYAEQTINRTLGAGVTFAKMAGADLDSEFELKFGAPSHRSVPLGASLTDECRTRLILERDRGRDLANFYVVTDSLEAVVKESRSLSSNASLAEGVIPQAPVGASGGFSRGREIRSNESVVVGFKTKPIADLLADQGVDGDVLACKQGDIEACGRAGLAYVVGVGVSPNPAKAFEYLEPACEAGDGASCGTLGYLYMSGVGAMRDDDRARPFLSKGCEGGVAVACLNLGFVEERGGRPEAAFLGYKRACDERLPDGCMFAGSRWLTGVGVLRDVSKGKSALEFACSSSLAGACVALASAHFQYSSGDQASFESGQMLLVHACQDLRDVESCRKAAEIYDNPNFGPHDSKTAKRFARYADWLLSN